jgi:hypothetical protein
MSLPGTPPPGWPPPGHPLSPHAPTCTQLLTWPPDAPRALCGRVAVRRYRTADGGWTYLCLLCGKGHEGHAERCYHGEHT